LCLPHLALLQAALIVADRHQSLQITGNGDVLEPHDGIIAIGSGSPYALAAARALIDLPGMDALSIGESALCGQTVCHFHLPKRCHYL
jgi:ATP-dependent HslUV protease subunit HslV